MRRNFTMILLGLLALQMFGRERIEGEVRCEDVGVMDAVVNAFPSNPADTVPSASTFTDLEGSSDTADRRVAYLRDARSCGEDA